MTYTTVGVPFLSHTRGHRLLGRAPALARAEAGLEVELQHLTFVNYVGQSNLSWSVGAIREGDRAGWRAAASAPLTLTLRPLVKSYHLLIATRRPRPLRSTLGIARARARRQLLRLAQSRKTAALRQLRVGTDFLLGGRAQHTSSQSICNSAGERDDLRTSGRT